MKRALVAAAIIGTGIGPWSVPAALAQAPEAGQPAPEAGAPAASSKDIDGETMFATSCGWCHQQGGRAAGRGPKLAGIQKDDAFIINRIKHGKPPGMPAFGRIAMSFAAVGALAQFALPGPTAARTLEAISQRGMIALCAHPKSLPFASKKGDRAGFQIELGQAIADRIGVSLARRWVLNSFQIRRADCDIV